MYCTKCGAKNEDDAKYCEQCGAKLQNTVDNIKPAVLPDKHVPVSYTHLMLPTKSRV